MQPRSASSVSGTRHCAGEALFVLVVPVAGSGIICIAKWRQKRWKLGGQQHLEQPSLLFQLMSRGQAGLTWRVGNDCAKLLAKAGRPSYSAGGRMTTLLALRVSASWMRLASAAASCCAKVLLLAHDAKTVLSSCSTQPVYGRLCFGRLCLHC